MSAKDFYIQPNWLLLVKATDKFISFWALPKKYARKWALKPSNQRDIDIRTSGER